MMLVVVMMCNKNLGFCVSAVLLVFSACADLMSSEGDFKIRNLLSDFGPAIILTTYSRRYYFFTR